MFIFVDTETTGTGSNDRLCQIAFKIKGGYTVNELFNPGMPISIDAMTVHHITNEMVLDKPAFRNSDTWSKLRDLVNSDGYVMVAHNAAFDVDMLKKEGIEPKNVICTLKLARYFDKDGVIPRYGLQYLRYYLKQNVDAIPHTALGDILVLEALFNRIYAKAVIEFGNDAVSKMIEVSKNPVFYRRMPFGKHKGLKMEEVPLDYLQWLSGTDLEEDLRYTIEQYLGAWGWQCQIRDSYIQLKRDESARNARGRYLPADVKRNDPNPNLKSNLTASYASGVRSKGARERP